MQQVYKHNYFPFWKFVKPYNTHGWLAQDKFSTCFLISKEPKIYLKML